MKIYIAVGDAWGEVKNILGVFIDDREAAIRRCANVMASDTRIVEYDEYAIEAWDPGAATFIESDLELWTPRMLVPWVSK
jgi:hypothetical protein